MCISYITFPCKICNTNIKGTDSATQCDICIHMECDLIHIDYKYLQGTNNPSFCTSCCNEIFPFGTANKIFFL